MRKNKIFTAIVILCLTCSVSVSFRALLSQDIQYLPDHPGKWQPPEIEDESRQDYNKLTRREYDTYMQELRGVDSIFREVKTLNPPVGVDPHIYLSIESPPYSDVQKPRSYVPVVGRIHLSLRPYIIDTSGKIEADPDLGTGFSIYLNYLTPIFRGERHTNNGVVEDWIGSGEPREMEDEQGSYFLAPKVTGNLQGFPIYDTAALVLVKSQKPLWVPVSQERFLRHAIRRAEEDLKTRKEEEKAKRAEPLPQDPELARVVKEARQEGEKLTRESVESTRALLAENPGYIRFLWEEYPKALAQELASLSPEQRAAQAYYSQDWKTNNRPSGLLDPSAPKAQPVVSPNPDFFNPALPRTAIQVIVVLGISSTDRIPAHPEKANTAVVRHFEVRQTLDWSKIAAVVQ